MRIRGLHALHAALILLGVAVMTAWFLAIGGRELFAGWRDWRPEYLALLAVATVSSMGLRFVRWQYLLRRAEVRVPVRASLSIYLASLVGTLTPAYVGEALRGWFLKRRFGIPLGRSLGALFFERVLDVLALCLIAVVALPGPETLGLVLVVVGGTLAACLLGFTAGARVGVPREMIRRLVAPGPFARSLAISIAVWCAAGLLVPFAAGGIGNGIGWGEGLGVFSTATLFGAVTLMPAGMGSTGSAAIYELTEMGFTLDQAVSAVTLMRLASTGLWLSVGTVFLALLVTGLRKREPTDAVEHFDEMAGEYEDQFSDHVWDHLVRRKIDMMVENLPDSARPAAGGVGADLGCGLGLQCREMNERGFRVFGLEASHELVQRARAGGLDVLAGSALALPFADASLDFVYAVGMLHHLSGPDAQREACREICRVLKPGGRLIVHETNPRNLLFSFYMGYVFPFLKSIDEGTEWWVRPGAWHDTPGFRVVTTRFFTFLPDFVPAFLMGLATRVERFLEASPARTYSVHYMAVLEKTEAT